jgi:ClpP class serine protease
VETSYLDFFWVFIFLVFFLPIFQQKWLARARKRFISKLQEERSSRAIVLLHRQELLSMLGIPFFRFITIEDSEQVLRAIYKTDPETPIDFIVHTPGGLVLASTQIAKALKRHKGKVTVFVPHYAMSGGSLIALAADEVVMHEDAVLGPVDPQIDRFPAASILKAVERKPIAEVDDKTLIYADQAEKAIQQLEGFVLDLLEGKMEPEEAKKLAKKLTQGTWTHDYPITLEEAKSMGLPVSKEIPDDVMELMELYPQPTRRQTSVEYTPDDKRKQDSA